MMGDLFGGIAVQHRDTTAAALGVAAIGSFVAGTIGLVGLTMMAPPLAEAALKFGPSEYFSLTVLGLLLAIARLLFDENWTLRDPNFPPGVWWVPDGDHLGFRVLCEDLGR